MRTDMIKPSAWAMKRAAQLGVMMARRDRHFRPYMVAASRFDGYVRFRNGHRELLERSDRFLRWQERLFSLSEKEGKRLGLRMDDSMASWDAWYSRVVVPLKNRFWEAWEERWRLPSRFAESCHPEVADLDLPEVLKIAGFRGVDSGALAG